MARYRRNESEHYAAGALSASTKPPRALTVQIGEPNVGTVGELGPVYGDRAAAILAKSLLRAGYPSSEIQQIGGVGGAPMKGAVARDRETGEPVAFVTVQAQGRTPKGGGKRNPWPGGIGRAPADTGSRASLATVREAIRQAGAEYGLAGLAAYRLRYYLDDGGRLWSDTELDREIDTIRRARGRRNPADGGFDAGAATVTQAIRDLVSDYGAGSDRLTVSRLRLYLRDQASYSDGALSAEIAEYHRARLPRKGRR